jgi:hypothetical protein
MRHIKRKEVYLPQEFEEQNFLDTIEDSIGFCKNKNVKIAIFRNSYGFHFSRELHFCEPDTDIKFVLIPELLKKVKYK